MSRGKRYDENPKLNLKKVIATIVAIFVFIMIIISLKKILSTEKKEKEFIQDIAYYSAYENGKWYVINSSGEKVSDLESAEMIIVPDNEKDVFIMIDNVNYEDETYKTKVFNSKGYEIFSGYKDVEPIENTNFVKTWYEDNVLRFKNGEKYGLINYEGKEILNAEYDKIYPLSGIEYCLIIEKDGKRGLYNTYMQELVIEPEYLDINVLSENYHNGYIVKNNENKFGLIGSDKSKILECTYDQIKSVFGNNYYVVINNSKLNVVSSSGKVILEPEYDEIVDINLDNFIVKKDNKYGIIDKDSNVIISLEYDDLKFSTKNYYIAKKNSKYGIIDNNNSNVVDFLYTSINYINEANFYKAENEDFTTNIIDSNFSVALKNIIISNLDLENGYLRIREKDDYKYYNFKFEEKSNKDFLTKNTLFLVKENGKYGYENKDGKRIVDCIYDDAREQNEYGYCAINKDGLWGALKSDGSIELNPSVDLNNSMYIDFIGQWHRYNDSNMNLYTK